MICKALLGSNLINTMALSPWWTYLVKFSGYSLHTDPTFSVQFILTGSNYMRATIHLQFTTTCAAKVYCTSYKVF